MSVLVAENKLVSVAYTIRDVNGTIVEHSDLPISYVHGVSSSPLFPMVESALEGLAKGERTVFFLTADQAFGAHDPSLIIPRKSTIPPRSCASSARNLMRKTITERFFISASRT
ncbi:MAG: hypothetical protein Ct9H300mP16_01140 [Pseudomonadota bacterium]|nr:MAG: hypothetical protein Ct9H300mP16_01140 [Pseudomonadota bacterium]